MFYDWMGFSVKNHITYKSARESHDGSFHHKHTLAIQYYYYLLIKPKFGQRTIGSYTNKKRHFWVVTASVFSQRFYSLMKPFFKLTRTACHGIHPFSSLLRCGWCGLCVVKGVEWLCIQFVNMFSGMMFIVCIWLARTGQMDGPALLERSRVCQNSLQQNLTRKDIKSSRFEYQFSNLIHTVSLPVHQNGMSSYILDTSRTTYWLL